MNKPFLRVTKGFGTQKHYLAVKQYINGTEKTLKSFGNAAIEDNWNKAIDYLLWALKTHYEDMKHRHIKEGLKHV